MSDALHRQGGTRNALVQGELLNNVLIIESSQDIAQSISENLRKAGLCTLVALDSVRAWQLLATVLPDVVLLNWLLANQSGASVANQLRSNPATKHIPIVMLGARKDRRRDDDLVMNVDGHVTHTQRYDEIVAAVIAVRRQRQIPRLTDKAVSLGGLTLDPATRRVYVERAGVRTMLSVGPTELRLLYFLMTHPERIFTQNQLQEEVWGGRIFFGERTVYTYVARLRASLRPGRCDCMIEAIHRVGYRFVSTGAADFESVLAN
jgi:two-component system phosphate regulon response regulator PhoB